MRSTIKPSVILALACVFTLGATFPGFALNRLSVLSGNYTVQVEQGFFRLEGRKDNVHKMRVKAGSYVKVMVNGDEESDLDVWVYDTDGDLVGSGEEEGDQEEVSFKAKQSGIYTIRVSNLGQNINTYQLSF